MIVGSTSSQPLTQQPVLLALCDGVGIGSPARLHWLAKGGAVPILVCVCSAQGAVPGPRVAGSVAVQRSV